MVHKRSKGRSMNNGKGTFSDKSKYLTGDGVKRQDCTSEFKRRRRRRRKIKQQ